MPQTGAMALLRQASTVQEADRNEYAIKRRKEWFGDKPDPMEVLLACLSLLADIGESVRTTMPTDASFRANDIENGIEECMHELAHHVALEISAGRQVKFEKRTRSISYAISELTPGMQHGNELDALAIELEAMWWLYCPQKQTPLAAGAREGGAWELGLSVRAINNCITDLRPGENAEYGASLALAVYEEIERQRREGPWGPEHKGKK